MPFSPDAGRVRLGHQPAFAGLRAVAITLVVALHLASSFVPSRSGLLPGGILGVDVFFVLSGFLITTLLFEQNDRFGRLHVVRFYRDRALRLLPTLVIALAGWDALALVTHVGSHRSLAEQNVAVLSYLGNWFQSYGHFLGIGIYQSWSLSVEEQFYLVWPAVILLVLRRGWSGRRTAVLLVVAIVVVVVWRAHLWLAHPSYLDVYYRTDARADALLVGALASVAWRAGWVRPARLRWLTLPTLGALGVLAWKVTVNSPGLYLGGFTAIALGAAVLVVSVIDGEHRSARVLGSRPMTYLGEISYALYLVHVAVIYAVQQYVHVGAKWQMLLTVAISLPLAAVIDQVVERPIRRYRHRLDRPARTDVAAPVREPVLVRD